MKYKYVEINRMTHLPPQCICSKTISLPFLFLRTEADSFSSNPDIFSWIITLHYIILRLGKTSYCRDVLHIHHHQPGQTRRTVKIKRIKILCFFLLVAEKGKLVCKVCKIISMFFSAFRISWFMCDESCTAHVFSL